MSAPAFPRPRAGRAVAFVILSVGLAGCARTHSTGSTAELTGPSWKLAELNGTPAVAGPAPGGANLQLTAEGSQVAGSTGCNRLSGKFERDGERLRFGQMATTRMACIDPTVARQEQDLVRTLGSVDRYTVHDDSLTLYANDRPVARFTALSPPR